jgi:hypothetical protein
MSSQTSKSQITHYISQLIERLQKAKKVQAVQKDLAKARPES